MQYILFFAVLVLLLMFHQNFNICIYIDTYFYCLLKKKDPLSDIFLLSFSISGVYNSTCLLAFARKI